MIIRVNLIFVVVFAVTLFATEKRVIAAGDKTTQQVDDNAVPQTCTYKTYEWSIEQKSPVNRRTVTKKYSEVTSEERSPDNPLCSVCEEDQREIDLEALGFAGAKKIKICYVYKESMTKALQAIAQSGYFKLSDTVGYRVGKTRGRVVDGKRTQFSNHSFGTAIDINAKFNGLYSKCNIKDVTVKNLKKCRLGIGGRWNPKAHPDKTITKDSVVYKKIINITGWRWGGEISGKIRDLMHFSITGY